MFILPVSSGSEFEEGTGSLIVRKTMSAAKKSKLVKIQEDFSVALDMCASKSRINSHMSDGQMVLVQDHFHNHRLALQYNSAVYECQSRLNDQWTVIEHFASVTTKITYESEVLWTRRSGFSLFTKLRKTKDLRRGFSKDTTKVPLEQYHISAVWLGRCHVSKYRIDS
eukprot:g22414.t1